MLEVAGYIIWPLLLTASCLNDPSLHVFWGISFFSLCLLKNKEPAVEKVGFSENLAAEKCSAYSSQLSQQTAIHDTNLWFYHTLMYLRLYWKRQFLEKSDYKRISATTKTKYTEKKIIIHCWVLRSSKNMKSLKTSFNLKGDFTMCKD